MGLKKHQTKNNVKTIVKKNRKQVRKEQRKQKKARKHDYYTNRNKPGKFVLKPPEDKVEENDGKSHEKETNLLKNNKNKKNSMQDQHSKNVAREKREQQKVQDAMGKQRKKQMLQANVEEEREIKRLEKQLKLNKRKGKSVPKSFAVDGLDYLLEVCDSENIKGIAEAEKMKELNDDFDEDFALMTGSSLLKPNNDSESDNSDSEDELNSKKAAKKRKLNDKSKGRNKKTKLEDSEDSLGSNEALASDDGDSLGGYEDNSLDSDEDNPKENSEDNSIGDEDGSIGSHEENFEDNSIGDEDDLIESNEDNSIGNEDGSIESDDENFEVNSIGDEDGSIGSGEDNSVGNKNGSIESDDENSEDNSIVDEDSPIGSDEENSEENEDSDNETVAEDGLSEDLEENKGGREGDGKNRDKKVNKDGTWEDIYGRLRDKDGNIINKSQRKYVPPAVRARLEGNSGDDKKRAEKLSRLRRQLKGLLNRLAESNMHNISNQIEELYMQNSRNDMNDTMTTLIFEALVTNVVTPERLLLEHVLLITILHANVGTEVGAHFLQTVVKKFEELFLEDLPVECKSLDNIVNIVAQLYNFKLFHSQLLYQILARLSNEFTEKNVECILCVLKSVGFTMRKDDPVALKELILDLQKKANSSSEDLKENPRVKFMLDILLAIKNNNMNKIPNYDTSYSEHLKKLCKGFIRKGNYVTQLNIALDDLLKADERGKWWVVGSAWTGKAENESKAVGTASSGYSQKLLDLAKKQRMNTDTRRNIFCIIMSAEDYLDAYEKLLHLGLKNQQEREIVHVLLHSCLQEKKYNPYYSFLAQKFCDYDRKFQMTIKYSVWDKLKSLTECSGQQIANLAKLLTHLFLEKGLPISTLKTVQFGDLDKITLRFIRQILLGVLLCEDAEQCKEVFERVAQSEKLKMFRESLRLFVHHFLLRNLKSGVIEESQKTMIEERAKIVERILTANDKRARF